MLRCFSKPTGERSRPQHRRAKAATKRAIAWPDRAVPPAGKANRDLVDADLVAPFSREHGSSRRAHEPGMVPREERTALRRDVELGLRGEEVEL